jgi:hypothetical protein
VNLQKPFDCVEFKRQSQRNLMEEYEARRSEFTSFRAFLDAKTRENEWARAFWQATVDLPEDK